MPACGEVDSLAEASAGRATAPTLKGTPVGEQCVCRAKGSAGEEVAHLLAWEDGAVKQKQVARPTFTSEALAAVGAVDAQMTLALAVREMYVGPLSRSVARGLLAEGGLAF
jgi:hypothetical protein